MSQVDDIKSRLDIVDVISEYLQLKPAGVNSRALCPFHSEKSPSFMVSRERQLWHCFGCAEGGDMFSFVMKIENVDFQEALKILANKAGVVLIKENPKIAGEKNTIVSITELTAKLWNKILTSSPQGEVARKYLEQRKITKESIEEFMIGYAPDSWDVTHTFLKEKGYKENDIFLAGLSVKKERGDGFYDRFRNRIIFPIRDAHSTIVGFGARAMPGHDSKSAKYINSPQTPIYNKSRIVYNLDKAKSSIKEKDLIVFVEGYMDVVSSWQAGVQNVVATSGTALTSDHIKSVKRYSNNLAMAFDSDEAGQNASFRGIDLVLGTEMNLKIISIPFGKDPDECIQKDPRLWHDAVFSSSPFMEYMLSVTLKKYPTDGIEDKKKISARLLPFIAKISNMIEQEHWFKKLASVLNVSEEILREAIARMPQKKDYPNISSPKSSKTPVSIKSRSQALDEVLLGILLKYPNNIPFVISMCAPEYLQTQELRGLYKKLIIYYTKYIDSSEREKFVFEDFCEFLNSEDNTEGKIFQKLSETLILLAEKDYFEYDSILIKEEIQKIITSLHAHFLHIQLDSIKKQLQDAEKNEDSKTIKELEQQFNQTANEINLLNA